jgi:hypothetical protein
METFFFSLKTKLKNEEAERREGKCIFIQKINKMMTGMDDTRNYKLLNSIMLWFLKH